MEWKLYREPAEYEASILHQVHRPDWPHACDHSDIESRLVETAEVIRHAIMHGARQIIDLGTGDGALLQMLSDLPTDALYGFDFNSTNVGWGVDCNRSVSLRNVVTDNDWTDEVTCGTCLVASEILQYLLDPHAFVDKMYQTKARWVVASTPLANGPVGQNSLEIWAWDRDGFESLFKKAGWQLIDSYRVGQNQIILVER